MSEIRFDDRVVVITGAGRGLGRAYALLLGARGAKVVVNDLGGSLKGEGVDVGPAQTVVNEIKAAGGEAVANTDSVAGNVRYGSIEELSYDDFKAVLDVHLLGAFHVVKAAFPLMRAQKYGRIVLTSSIGGLYGNKRITNYAISKSGMIGLNNVIALEGEDANVKSNLIVPSAVTRMAEGLDISKYPPMDPELVAPLVAWLVHERCSLTGEMLVSIAGRMARAFIAESVGVYQPSWSIEQVDARIGEICDATNPWVLPVVPHGHSDHIGKSFEMARKGGTK
jgi:NAD(P)-dependent dehydrogenase (short-subunit alcohol dehydrogenase family)